VSIQAKGKKDLPKKLSSDAIIEAVLEIRFNHDPKKVSEVFLGQIALKHEWKSFESSRTPIADIPENIRRTQADLRHAPVFVMTAPNGEIQVQVGPQVFIYSRRGAYPGWDNVLWPELDSALDHLFSTAGNLDVTRLGLRYINALRSDVHGVSGIDDIALNLNVADRPVTKNLNCNFGSRVGTDFETMTRVATVDLAQGIIPQNTTVIVDIDVYTSTAFRAKSAKEVKAWATSAHIFEKESFFAILGETATERLRED
jgi:uncharacterized protein (TIGR04255 family)